MTGVATDAAEEAAGLTFREAVRMRGRELEAAEEHAERMMETWHAAGRPSPPDVAHRDGETRQALVWALGRPRHRLTALMYRQAAARAEVWAEIAHRLCPGHRWTPAEGVPEDARIRTCDLCGAVTA